MAKIWIIVPPLTGHINPTVSVAAALSSRGHTVTWVGHPTALSRCLPEEAARLLLPEELPAELLKSMTERSNKVRGLASLKFLWEDFLIPLATQMVPALQSLWESTLESDRPELLLVDQQAVGGALFARLHKLAFVSSCTTSAGVSNPLAGLPKVKAWLDEQLASLERAQRLPPIPSPELSPLLCLVYSTPALTGPNPDQEDGRYPEKLCFVGPSIARRPSSLPDFPWEQLDPTRKKILLSLGTVNAERGRRFFSAALEGLGEPDRPGSDRLPWQLIVVGPAKLVGPLPRNVLRFDYVPQLELLPKLDAVICHGGQNTVTETLAHGLPLVVAPIRDDQPVIAEQITRAGCGLRLRFSRCNGQEIRGAVERVLGDPKFQSAAKSIQRSFLAAGTLKTSSGSLSPSGGSERAAEAIEALLVQQQRSAPDGADADPPPTPNLSSRSTSKNAGASS